MRKLLLHLLFWLVFFLMWNRVVNFYISNMVNRVYFSFLDVSLIAIAFYIIYLYIIPRYLSRKNVGLLLLSCTLLTIGLSAIASWLMGVFLHHGVMPIQFDFAWNYKDLQYNRFFIALIGILAGCFVRLAIDRLEVGRKMEIMEKERSKAELTYLKAQMNPHFLFNSLNSLYAQLDIDPETAKPTLLSLADLLRYQLYECNTEYIALERELQYLENYFGLQKIRKDNCQTAIQISDGHQGLMIAPLLLIPFVENAFKYVSDHDDRENYIRLRISLSDGRLEFHCANTFDPKAIALDPGRLNGIGLNNVNKRLALIYPDNYVLRTTTTDGIYQVTLKINLRHA